TDMSKVEFGICVDGWNRVVFKTVNDPKLSARELYFHHKIAASRSEHLVHLLDEFTDNSDKQVMVFPRMNSAEIYGHDLLDIARIARQMLTALEELHGLGIAHLDITPTNIMSDPNDPSHIEVIDFGLACDISTTDDGRLPSRGTCGFVAPEVLSGHSNDLRADIYSAGVVLGMMLQKYLPTVNLRLLGGPLVRSDTTDGIISTIDELLDAYKYTPEPASFVDCNTTFTHPQHNSDESTGTTALQGTTETYCSPAHSTATVAHFGDNSTHRRDTSNRRSRGYFDKSDDEAAACAAAYMGGGSMFGGYGSLSDDEDDGHPGSYGKQGTSTNNTNDVYGHSNYDRTSRVYGGSLEPEPMLRHPNTSGMIFEQFGQRLSTLEGCDRYYTSSPNNTPVYARSINEAGSSSGAEYFNVRDIVEGSSSISSNVRYAANVPAAHSLFKGCGMSSIQTYGAAGIRTASSVYSNGSSNSSSDWDNSKESVKKPGKVPEAVLHAADLLRWTLQANPQCRPTATQALGHPFLALAGIQRKRRRASVGTTPTASRQEDSGGLGATRNGHTIRLLTHKPKRSDSGVAPERNLGTASPMCDGACSPCTESGASASSSSSSSSGGCLRASAVEAAMQRSREMFKNTAVKDVRLWEKEMHSRLGGYPSSMNGEHGVGHEPLYSSSSYGHMRDEVNSFYSSNCDDITSYFY
ncbi:hypothetical protein H4S06_002898, partial [Coemansia sp. BCRC 34490]